MVVWESLGIIEESRDIDEQSSASFQQNFQFGLLRQKSMTQAKENNLTRFQTRHLMNKRRQSNLMAIVNEQVEDEEEDSFGSDDSESNSESK